MPKGVLCLTTSLAFNGLFIGALKKTLPASMLLIIQLAPVQKQQTKMASGLSQSQVQKIRLQAVLDVEDRLIPDTTLPPIECVGGHPTRSHTDQAQS